LRWARDWQRHGRYLELVHGIVYYGLGLSWISVYGAGFLVLLAGGMWVSGRKLQGIAGAALTLTLLAVMTTAFSVRKTRQATEYQESRHV